MRFRGVPNTDYLEIVFVYSFQLSLSAYFLGFYVLFGVQGLPKGLPEGTLRSRKIEQKSSFGSQRVTRGFRGAKSDHFGGHLGVFWESFLMYF